MKYVKWLLSLIASASLAVAGCANEPAPSMIDDPPAPETGPSASSGSEGDRIATENGDLVVQPINHATFAMNWNGETIYVDPVGGAAAFEGLPAPDLILITDVHGDHLDGETLGAVASSETVIVAPAAVVEELPEALQAQAQTLANGDQIDVLDLSVEAVPMYNLTEDRLQYHERGRGNGYVVTAGGARIYISGDTEDIPEMRQLEDIDVAFIAFNLPYTMTEEQAASAVGEFAPDVVYPYHYQGSDVEEFASLVASSGAPTEVRLREWY